MDADRWRQVEELFDKMLDCPPADRTAFLDSACADDTALKIEVTRLLALHEKAPDSFLNTLDFQTARRISAADTDATTPESNELNPDEEPKRLIGSYEIIREIGRGGMGEVYLARRADDQYQKQVAIKLLRAGLENEDIIRRFRNERQILAGLDHPNIAHFLEGGATADGKPYYVMESITGQRIDDYCDDRRLPVVERLKLFIDVCAAVQYAHQRLIIHRDIKPSNILVTEDGAVKLLDFGIAKLLDPELMDRTVETRTHERLMTPQYASPEQIRGQQVTTATDVYSLGVVLYQLLCGRPPYSFESRSMEEFERVVCRQDPVRPSEALADLATKNFEEENTQPIASDTPGHTHGEPIESLRERLANDLDNIVMMALRKEPERRYASVEQLSEDIRRYLEGRPIIARPNTVRYRAGKFIRRNKAAVAASAVIIATLIGGVVLTAWQAQVARRERDKAERRFNQVRKLANAVVFKYHDGVEHLAGSTAVRQMMVKDALEYLDNLSQEGGNDLSLLQELAEAYEKVGRIQGAPTHSNLGDYAGGLATQKRALAIRESLVQADPKSETFRRALSRSYLLVSQLTVYTGQTSEALDYLQKARALLEKLTAENPANFSARTNLGTAYVMIGSVRQSLNDLPGALEYFRKSLAQAEADAMANPNNDERRRDLSISLIYVGDAFYEMNNLTEAVSYQRRALGISEKLAADNPNNSQYQRDAGVALQRLASSQERAGDYRGALENYRKVEALNEQAAAADPSDALTKRDLVVSHLKIGRTLAALNETDSALVYLRKMASSAEKLGADPSNTEAHSDLATAHQMIGDTLAKRGEWREALQSYRKSLAVNEALAAKDKSDTITSSNIALTHRAIGDALLKLKDLTGAEAGYRKAIDIYEPLAAEDPTDETLRRDQALAYEGLGDVSEALAARGKLQPEQANRWKEARNRYQQSLDIWRDLVKRNVLRFTDARKPDEVAVKLARCDAALSKLNPR
ncbi:MAG TPA: protein kinase [Blastocatellia bacterium]|nr:protein kinase [Blastocatellia bacterium]